MTAPLALELPSELVEQIAQRAAEILVERQADTAGTWLDVAEAAEHMRCGTSRIYSLVSAGRIPVHRDGSRLLFDRHELDEFVRAGGAKRP